IQMQIEEQSLALGDYLAILNRRKLQFIVPVLIIMMISIALAFSLPPVYRSEATVLIEQQDIPTDLVRSTVTSYADQRIQVISQSVMTTGNLGRIIDQYGLYSDLREKRSTVSLVETLRDNIKLEMISAGAVNSRSGRPSMATIAFKLSFSYKDPQLTQKVTSELISLYLNANLKRRTESAVHTSSFLSAETEKLNKVVSELEEKLAAFNEVNKNSLPELQQLNMQLLERNERELKEIDQQSRSLEERRIYLRSELVQLEPHLDGVTVNGKRILGPQDRLSALKAELLSLSAKYAPDHPTLVRIQKEINGLESGGGSDEVDNLQAQRDSLETELAALTERYTTQHPDVIKLQRRIEAIDISIEQARSTTGITAWNQNTQVNNPAYIQLRAQLIAAESELNGLKSRRQEVKDKLAEIENRLVQSPQVEREYRALTRDYDNALQKYKEVKAKLLEAELSESLELESKAERFSLIEPAQVPEKPAKPNRLVILFFGFVFSIGGGIGVVAVAESLSNVIKDPKQLLAIAGAPPLVVIPYIETIKDQEAKRTTTRYTIMFLVVSWLLGLVLVHLLVTPLDSLWYTVVSKLGMEGH
ncbi:MAG: Wzz/FepE/Etk N-terminal domain-containing protein, partial [Candidatus Sedimenticola sp. 1PA]